MDLLASQFLEMRQRRHLRLFLHEAMLDAELGDYLREQVFAPLVAAAVQRMHSLIELGIMRPVDPVVAAWTLVGAVVGLTFFTDVGAAPALEAMPPEALAAQVSDVFLNGLRAAPRM